MRDPKTHAKVLAKRWGAVRDAQLQAEFETSLMRWRRLARLRNRIRRAEHAHRAATKWIYDPWATPPYWKHDGEIIPDTEEEA